MLNYSVSSLFINKIHSENMLLLLQYPTVATSNKFTSFEGEGEEAPSALQQP